MTRSSIQIAALGAAAALTGCWVPMERGRQMEARIQRLEVQSAEQQRTFEEQRELVKERVAKVDQKGRVRRATSSPVRATAR